MKTLAVLLACCVIALMSCVDDQSLVKSSELHPRTSLDYTDAGTMHNDGLDLLMDNTTCEWAEMTRADALDSINEILGTYFEETLEEEYQNDGLSDLMDLMCNDWDFSDVLDEADNLVSTIESGYPLNAYESSLIHRFVDLFSINFLTATDAQKVDRIQDSLTVYFSLLSTNPLHYPQTELKAAIYLAYGSSVYWDGKGGTGGEVEHFVQLDCFGYLIGWAAAWIEDQGPGYSNSQSDQWRRIGCGVASGICMSRGKWWRVDDGEIFQH